MIRTVALLSERFARCNIKACLTEKRPVPAQPAVVAIRVEGGDGKPLSVEKVAFPVRVCAASGRFHYGAEPYNGYQSYSTYLNEYYTYNIGRTFIFAVD
ncbi:MAG: hypothetical protein BGP01_01710 [Paludibacter sp. 47-17]|nr:MAG: hypothetical protein BGP01_01710 [Paludibacter sp. 47-17]